MKNINIVAGLLLLLLGFQSCKKYSGDSYDFSDKSNDYIRVTPGQNIVINSNTADTIIGMDTFYYYLPDSKTVNLDTRMGFSEAITITYGVTIDSTMNNTFTGILSPYKTSKKMSVSYDGNQLVIDGNNLPVSDTTINGLFILQSAVGQSKGSLRIGYPLETTNVQVAFVANKPDVLHHY